MIVNPQESVMCQTENEGEEAGRDAGMVARRLLPLSFGTEGYSAETVVRALYQSVLGRDGDPAGVDWHTRSLAERGNDVPALSERIRIFMESTEFRSKLLAQISKDISRISAIDNHEFRIPTHLRVSADDIQRVLLIGSCLMDSWSHHLSNIANNVQIDRITFNNASILPPIDKETAKNIDFQILQIPLRSIIPEALYFGLKYRDDKGHALAFEEACQNLFLNLSAILKYNTEFGLRSFLLNFVTPQQNPMGRMQDRYDLSNMVYFVEQLNKKMYEYVSSYNNVYILDYEQITSTYGKKYLQDDSIMHLNHGSALGGIEAAGDEHRLEPAGDPRALYAPAEEKYIAAVWYEAIGAFRSIQQKDSVKLVIFDLDDTLWRGVGAENDVVGPAMTEGWPTGILEAVSYLWRRGILVALVSKNDETTAVGIWNELYGTRFDIAKFVAIRISWQQKSDSVRDILAKVKWMRRSWSGAAFFFGRLNSNLLSLPWKRKTAPRWCRRKFKEIYKKHP